MSKHYFNRDLCTLLGIEYGELYEIEILLVEMIQRSTGMQGRRYLFNKRETDFLNKVLKTRKTKFTSLVIQAALQESLDKYDSYVTLKAVAPLDVKRVEIIL